MFGIICRRETREENGIKTIEAFLFWVHCDSARLFSRAHIISAIIYINRRQDIVPRLQ